MPACLVCPVEQFRAKFPRSLRAMLERRSTDPHPSAKMDFRPKPNQYPQIKGMMGVKPVTSHCLTTVEHMFIRQEFIDEVVFPSPEPPDLSLAREKLMLDFETRRIRTELLNLMSCPRRLFAQAVQARLFWQLLRRKHRLVIFHRDFSPAAGTLFKLGQQGRQNLLARIIAGSMPESDFAPIMAAAGRLSAASHVVSLCDALEPDTFLPRLRLIHRHFDYALCDWNLTAQEKAGACRISRHSQIQLLCPDY